MADVLATRGISLRPTPLEIASGIVYGGPRTPPPLGFYAGPDADERADRGAVGALAALEAAILPALARPPCLVSFSGGVDSSFVLTVAVGLARRAGLPAPIPITWRFPDAPRAGESDWQERVVSGLGISDWTVLQATDDLDFIGPVAQEMLTRYGVLFPFNLHLHLPLIAAAAGGSLLTGAGGDQVFSGRRRPGHPGTVRTWRRRVLGTSLLDSPRSRQLLAAVPRRPGPDRFPWLRPAAAREVARGWLREIRSEPRRIDGRIAWHASRRDLTMTCSSLATVAADRDVQVVNPLLARDFLAALGRQFAGVTNRLRSELLLAISGDSLPEFATADRPKAYFAEVFLQRWTREFARSWDGGGVDETLVDADVLRDLWSRWPIPLDTAGLVQQLWLRETASSTGRRRRGGRR